MARTKTCSHLTVAGARRNLASKTLPENRMRYGLRSSLLQRNERQYHIEKVYSLKQIENQECPYILRVKWKNCVKSDVLPIINIDRQEDFENIMVSLPQKYKEEPAELLANAIRFWMEAKNIDESEFDGIFHSDIDSRFAPDLENISIYNGNNLIAILKNVKTKKDIAKFRYEKKEYFCYLEDFLSRLSVYEKQKLNIPNIPKSNTQKDVLFLNVLSFAKGEKEKALKIIQKENYGISEEKNSGLIYAANDLTNKSLKWRQKEDIKKLSKKIKKNSKISEEQINKMNEYYGKNLFKKREGFSEIGFKMEKLETILLKNAEKNFILVFNALGKKLDHCVAVKKGRVIGTDQKLENLKGKYLKYYIIDYNEQ